MAASLTTMFGIAVFAVTLLCFSPSYGSKFSPEAASQTVVIALGGFNGAAPSRSLEIYSSSKTRTGASLPAPRNGFGSGIFNNTIYVVGGFDGKQYQNNFWSYDVARNKWNTDLPPPPSPVFGSAAVELGGRLYVLGGLTSPSENSKLQQVYAFETRLRKWYTLDTVLPQASKMPCAVSQDQHLYYMPEGKLFHSDDGADSWESLYSPGESRLAAACVAVGKDAILLAGGANGNGDGLNTVEIYNITIDQWKSVAPMQTVRIGGSAELMAPGSQDVLICGGSSEQFAAQKSCEVYNWKEDKWSGAKFGLNEARYNFGLFVTNV